MLISSMKQREFDVEEIVVLERGVRERVALAPNWWLLINTKVKQARTDVKSIIKRAKKKISFASKRSFLSSKRSFLSSKWNKALSFESLECVGWKIGCCVDRRQSAVKKETVFSPVWIISKLISDTRHK